ncbi:bidirectional sugar transporter SWEET1-like [Lycium barbarum]|uniref:bidirectional sugar transporter SWEET1-like n=1 Tax=Lycium barbarum TaxID=112863 RepID=UPI00293E7136|nr:bidirectional sugar transporter SWEET1-like [Lycium barbarum]
MGITGSSSAVSLPLSSPSLSLVSMLASHGNSRKLCCVIAATIFSTIMYGSPLSIIRLVIKTKSVEFMPLFLFLCGASCFAFGLLGKGPFVAIPHGFDFGLGTVATYLICNIL